MATCFGGVRVVAILSPKTIQNLHYQIKRKLGVSSDIEMTKLALSWGLGDEVNAAASAV